MKEIEFSMGKNLEDYIKIYDVIDLDLCKKLITKIKKSTWETHGWQSYGGVTDKNLGEEELTVTYALNAREENAEIMKAFHTALGMYVKDINSNNKYSIKLCNIMKVPLPSEENLTIYKEKL
jgi:hypothetical protein